MMDLAVIYGSRACEHDVSIITALQAMDNADPAKYNLIPIYIGRDGRWFTGEALRKLEFYTHFDESKVTPCRLAPLDGGKGRLVRWPAKKGLFAGSDDVADIDAALLCLHGMNGEDGTLQGMLELFNIPYTSAGLLGSSAGMDKIAMKLIYQGAGFPVLPMVWFLREDYARDPDKYIDKIESAFGYPAFVKPANLGSSIGISKAKDRETLKAAIEVASHYDKRILVEKGVAHAKEINCAALGYAANVRASVCEMPASWEEFLTFDDKYLRGGKSGKQGAKTTPAKSGMASLARQIPAPIPEEMTKRIQDLSIEMFKVMDLKGVVRVDYILDQDDNTLYVNEVNTIPGSLAFYLWEPLGISYRELIDILVSDAIAAQKEKEKSVFSFESALLSTVKGVGAKR